MTQMSVEQSPTASKQATSKKSRTAMPSVNCAKAVRGDVKGYLRIIWHEVADEEEAYSISCGNSVDDTKVIQTK